MTTELNTRSSRPIAIWLLIGVGMIIIQVLLGGITRLTGSGLSITEWNVVTGTLPPMNEQQWMTAVSYTHLDVYKRQAYDTAENLSIVYFAH